MPCPFWDTYSSKIVPEPNSGCWFWVGGMSTRDYGVIYTSRGHNIRAHRVAYEMTKGSIPAGLVIDHLCRVHCCVNPDHLEAVTQAENVRRGAVCANHPDYSRSGLVLLSPEEKKKYRRFYRQSERGRAAKRRELDKRKIRRANGERIA